MVFSATRALGAAPDFVIDNVAFVLDADSAGADVRASGTVAATARDGERDLAVILVDDAGNTSDALALGSVVVDGTGPELASVDAPSTVASGSELLVRVAATEVLGEIRCEFSVTLSDFRLGVDGVVDGSVGTCSGVV